MLDDCIHVAIHDNTFRRDDLEFTFAARVCFVCVEIPIDYRAGQNVFRFLISSRIGNDLQVFKSTLNRGFQKLLKLGMKCYGGWWRRLVR